METKSSIDNVKEYFKIYGIENRIQTFNVSSATVPLAAKALNCLEAEIAKSLSFYGIDNPILVVTAGDAKIDNSKFKKHFKIKAKMLSYEANEELIGHPVGGVCPFALKEGVEVYLDISLKDHNKIYPACGSSNSAIELTIPELEKYSKYKTWVDVCKF